MNFDFSSDQQLLRDQIRRLLEKKCPSAEVRKTLDGENRYSETTYRALMAQGVGGAAIEEQYGGLGLGHLELCVVAEEIGRVLAPIPFSSSIYLVAEALRLAGSEDQKTAYLPALADGSLIATAALFSTNGKNTVKLAGDSVEGTCLPVPDGLSASLAIILAEDTEAGGDGLTAVLINLDDTAVTREPVRTLDPSRPHAKLTLRDCSVEILGKRGAGATLRDEVYNRAAVLFAFEQLGGADRALEIARDYALERYAFGRQIASYQAIKHKLADVYARNHIARAHAYYGAWALSNDAPELALAAASARVAATQAFNLAAQENIQVHGGIGFTWEADCHLFYRRARMLALNLGSVQRWQTKLFKELSRSRNLPLAAEA